MDVTGFHKTTEKPTSFSSPVDSFPFVHLSTPCCKKGLNIHSHSLLLLVTKSSMLDDSALLKTDWKVFLR